MIDTVKDLFWHTATQLVSEILVPVIAMILALALFYSALGIGGKR